jgi:c-di-GMP-binding flagellar brake protein YcgR
VELNIIHAASQAKEANSSVRRHERALLSVPITLHHLTGAGIGTTRGITLDISEGGLGALVQGDLRMGETVEIDLPLRGHPLKTVAIVRHTSSIRSGFEFLGLTPEERQKISDAAGNC